MPVVYRLTKLYQYICVKCGRQVAANEHLSPTLEYRYHCKACGDSRFRKNENWK